MNAKTILNTLAKSDIDLYLDESNQLKAKAPKGAITEEFRTLIKEHKASLVAYLEQLDAIYTKRDNNKKIEAAKRVDGKADISFAQQRLWFIDNLQNGSPEYNMPMAFDTKGELNLQVLHQVFATILERHEVLRSVYVEHEGRIVQQIRTMDEVNFTIQVEDLSHLSGNALTDAVTQRMDADITTSFNLESDLMLRVSFLKKTVDTGVLLFNMHHIASDGWSVEVLTKEFVTLYHAYHAQLPNPLPPLDVQYADYAQWQKDYLAGDVLEKQLSYWQTQLDEAPAVHSLPLDKARPVTKQQQADVVRGSLPEDIAQKLLAVAKAYELTPFMLLHGALALLLSRHSNSNDIVIGTPVANRKQSELESLIGFFVNTLVLRTNTAHKTLADYLSHIKTVHLGAQTNQDVPFEQLIDHLKVPRSKSYNPLFQIMMTTSTSYGIDDGGMDTFSLPSVELQANASDLIQVKFDLDIDLNISEQGVGLRWTYDLNLFSAHHIEQLNAHLCRLLTEISTLQNDRGVALSEIAMLSDSETHQLVHSINDSELTRSTDHCIHELFEQQAELHPNNIAVVIDEQALTYQQLNEKANQVARYLRANHDIRPDTFVGLCVERSLEMVIGIVGILKAGAAYVPLDPDYPQSRLSYMFDDASLEVVLSQSHLDSVLSDFKGTIVSLDHVAETNQGTTHLFSQYDSHNLSSAETGLTSNNLAYVIYTSGSTGQPKGVMIEHQSLVYSTVCRFDIYEEFSSFLLISSMSFDSSIAGIFSSLTSGAKLCLLSAHKKADTNYIVSQLKRHEISHLLMVPSFYDLILNEVDSTALPALRGAIVAGESCSKNVVEKHYQKFALTGVKLFNEYGPTEASVWSSVALLKCDETVSIGKALPGKSLFIMHNDMLVPYGSVGELYIGGQGLARGYLNRSDLTAQRFVTNPFYQVGNQNSSKRLYKTGDLVRYLPNGNLEFIGRADDQVKVRGFRIELGEVEAQLEKLDCVNSALVTTYEIGGANQLVGYVKASDGMTDELPEHFTNKVRVQLGNRVPEHMIPSMIIPMTEWPLTANGKMDRKALPNPSEMASKDNFIVAANDTEQALVKVWCDVLQLDKVSVNSNFFEIGGNSLLSIKLQKAIQQHMEVDVELTDLFEYPTIGALAKFLSGEHDDGLEHGATLTTRSFTQECTDIAVIGMAGRFPDATNVDQFWQNISAGKESITFFSDEELVAAGVAPAMLKDPRYIKSMDVLSGVADFDAKRFDYTPREAELLDPQHRLMLEVSSDALEHSGYGDHSKPQNVGVFVGVTDSAYLIENLLRNPDVVSSASQSLVASTSASFLATKLSYKLNLTGPSVNVLTACSSSLVNVHQACNSLLLNECEMALAGGARIASLKADGYLYQEGGVNSADGHCRPFDIEATGTRGGSGGCVLLLKRLDKALADKDTIHAVIKGTAVNNDAAEKVGYMAPSISGQAAVIKQALKNANVEANSIQYLEAHGTGTKIGDPIEVKALKNAFATEQKGYCALGSVKANIGHLDVAAGAAGMIKVIEAMKHRQLPPTINYTQSNTQINFEQSPFYVNTESKYWDCDADQSRRAGVSSFGIGGTNAHVILEQAPEVEPSSSPRKTWLLPISAKSSSAVKAACENLRSYLATKADDQVNLHDIAYTLQVGRTQYEYSTHISCSSLEDAITQLDSHPKVIRNEADDHSVVFMFPGQGAQYIEMAQQLYLNEPQFKLVFDQCADTISEQINVDLRAVLYPQITGQLTPEAAQSLLAQTRVTQPALFAIEYSLATLMQSWGIKPDVMIGHSIGEYVAACLAEVFTVEDALKLVCARGSLMQQAQPGSMLSIAMPVEHLRPLLQLSDTCLAAVNSANNCVAAGSEQGLAQLQALLIERGIDYRPLHTSHAFHSKMMDGILDEFSKVFERVELNAPKIRYVSNVSGKFITNEQAQNPEYWLAHLRGTVLFADGIETVLSDTNSLADQKIFVEVGPGRSLTTLVKKNRDAQQQVVLSVTRHANEAICDQQKLLSAVGSLWSHGVDIDWFALNLAQVGRRVPLPTYPFERVRYWVDAKTDSLTSVSSHGAKLAADKWWSVPIWKQSTAMKKAKAQLNTDKQHWLLIMDSHGVAEELASQLMLNGHTVYRAYSAESFNRLDDQSFNIDIGNSQDYETLLEVINKEVQLDRVVHLLGVAPTATENMLNMTQFNQAQRYGAYSALYTVQAIVKAGLDDKLSIDFITNDVERVTGDETLNIGKSTIKGLCKVAPQEYPELSCHHIDVHLNQATRDHAIAKLCQRLSLELHSQQRAPLVALRGNQRWEPDYETELIDTETPAAHRLVDGGVYFITGGLGNIGLLLAKYISQAVAAPKLVLVGRSKFPERATWPSLLEGKVDPDLCKQIEQITQVEKSGAEVIILSADSANLQQMQDAMNFVENQFGAISGVIHAAGQLHGSMTALIETTEDDFEKQYRAKANGVIVLETLLQTRQVDFCILMSSLSSVLGGLGFSAYAAGNQFMDAFAQSKHEQGDERWVSVNWDGWSFSEATQDDFSMTPEEGIEAFAAMMSIAYYPQLVNSTGALEKRLSQWIDKKVAESQQALYERPELESDYVAPRNEVEEKLVAIWQQVLGIEQIGIEDNFFDLGGDSLVVTRVISEIRKMFSVNESALSIKEFFEKPIISQLSEKIAAELENAEVESKKAQILEAGKAVEEGVF
ncbi:non-ribosomal peptide synthetase/type I polyketide synthase [Pseudoalteromonas sp. S2755]|uniref:non-ribosomal peptide synthetase/type I polyketide synthase n=1 Tax=Pseudoalteromonas sp. S2755 TaxID=2066523 RepID=UPI00110A5915|nr:non-ribosomal peptide synthetase/type I polyketide synthase [Pseudoalteromonas sp. S2755]TMN45130.1 non-ribosomal peptide synthetase [Pseudoalteromonas sp. S2755]